MANLQNMNHADPEVAAAVYRSTLGWLQVPDLTTLFAADLPVSGPVPPLTQGLFRFNDNPYEDTNAWDRNPTDTGVTTSSAIQKDGVIFNFTRAMEVLPNGLRFMRRTIRQHHVYGNMTLVHYRLH